MALLSPSMESSEYDHYPGAWKLWRPGMRPWWRDAPKMQRLAYEGALPGAPEWHATVLFVGRDGRLVVEALELHPRTRLPSSGLTSTVTTNSLLIGGLLTEARGRAREIMDLWLTAGEVYVTSPSGEARRVTSADKLDPGLASARPARGGRPAVVPKESHALVAKLYVDELARGRGARARVAAYLGGRWTDGLVRDRIREAQRFGFITRARPGSGAGRRLTDAGARVVGKKSHASIRRRIRTLEEGTT
jgi:hypothetical protein